MQIRSAEEAIAEVKERAERTRVAAGVDKLHHPDENISPCDGRLGETSDIEEVYYIHGSYQLQVPAEQQLEVLARVRDAWQREGLTIKGERTFPDGDGGEVRAAADNGYTMWLESGKPPAMLLVVSSPCYRR